MTYHKDKKRWEKDSVNVVGRGQEFIAEPKKIEDCKKWLKNIFKDAKTIEEVKEAKKLAKQINKEALRRAYLNKTSKVSSRP